MKHGLLCGKTIGCDSLTGINTFPVSIVMHTILFIKESLIGHIGQR